MLLLGLGDKNKIGYFDQEPQYRYCGDNIL